MKSWKIFQRLLIPIKIFQENKNSAGKGRRNKKNARYSIVPSDIMNKIYKLDKTVIQRKTTSTKK